MPHAAQVSPSEFRAPQGEHECYCGWAIAIDRCGGCASDLCAEHRRRCVACGLALCPTCRVEVEGDVVCGFKGKAA